MQQTAVAPPRIMPSISGPELPPSRVADLPGITSLQIGRLFPEIPKEIYLKGDDFSAIRQATENALKDVNMSMIKPDHSVNLLCSEHGFSILEGGAYAEMLRTIKDVVQERTGCLNIRLRFSVGSSKSEAREMIPYFELDQDFDKIASAGPFDRGVAIETEIGTLYGIAKVAFGGNIQLEDIEALKAMDVDILDIGRSIIDAPLLDMRMEVMRIEN